MKESVKKLLHGTRQSVMITVVLMLICGLAFPCLLTGISGLIFPSQANGNLVSVDGNNRHPECGAGVYRRLLYVEPSFCLSL